MPVCQHCGRSWSWKQTFKKQFTLDTAIECFHCESKQYLSRNTKLFWAAASFIPPIIILLTFFIPAWIVLLLFLADAIFTFISAPFLMKLSNEEKHLWQPKNN